VAGKRGPTPLHIYRQNVGVDEVFLPLANYNKTKK